MTHKYVLTKGNQPLCERCKTILTIEHLILQCDISTAKKTTQSQTHPKRQPNGQWDIIKPVLICEIHQDLQKHIKNPSFCCR